jgi:hemerythrin
MSVFKWDNEYSVNTNEIVQQHKQFTALINELYEAMRSGQSSSVIGKIFKRDGTICRNAFCDYREAHDRI